MNNDATIESLVKENLPLARYIAWKMCPWDFEDAFSWAMRGLHEAAKAFDPVKGEFGGFVSFSIRNYVLRKLRASRAARRGYGEQILNFDDHWNGGEGDRGYELKELIADPNYRHPAEAMGDSEGFNVLMAAVATLRPRHRLIIERRFGLNGVPAQTQEEVAVQIGKTHQRVQQMEQEAFAKLRKTIKRLQDNEARRKERQI